MSYSVLWHFNHLYLGWSSFVANCRNQQFLNLERKSLEGYRIAYREEENAEEQSLPKGGDWAALDVVVLEQMDDVLGHHHQGEWPGTILSAQFLCPRLLSPRNLSDITWVGSLPLVLIDKLSVAYLWGGLFPQSKNEDQKKKTTGEWRLAQENQQRPSPVSFTELKEAHSFQDSQSTVEGLAEKCAQWMLTLATAGLATSKDLPSRKTAPSNTAWLS